jgi:hypothetical protein
MRNPRFVPLAESLEGKLAPSGTIALSFGMVLIKPTQDGLAHSATAAVADDGLLHVNLDGAESTFNPSAVKSLFYVGQPGDDVFVNSTSYATIAIGFGGGDTYFLTSPSPSSIQIIQGFAFG